MRHRILILGALVCMWVAVGWAQQPPPPQAQPGLKWTEEQLKKAASAVRAGRKLTPKSWPNGARVAVCLSFDPDNFSADLNRGITAPVTLSEGEYGATTGLPRVLELLDRYNIPASFYVPAVAAMLHPQMIEEIMKRRHHEVGTHGWIHENPLELNDAAEEWRLLTQAIDYLTKATGKRPVGNRNPSWTFSPYTMELIKKAGFLYDSSLQAMDQPYEVLINGQPSGVVELLVSWLLDDWPVLNVKTGLLPSPEAVLQVFQDDFDRAYQEGTLFMLTMHPHITGMRSRIGYLEKLILYMKSKPGVWFATGEQIANYVKQQSGTTN